MKKRTLLPVLFAGLGVLLAGADWPQWRGPDRSDVSRETGLLKSWPKEGPKLLWTFDEAGIGYSGPAIVSDKSVQGDKVVSGESLYVMGADEKNEFLLAVDVNTGKKLWSTDIGPYYSNKYGSGPRSTPTVDGRFIYVLGATGDLGCFDRESGAKKWGVNLTDNALGGKVQTWGYSESPLVDGDHVVCTPGGSKGTLAAFDKTTGSLVWRSKDVTDTQGYSSIVVAELAGVRQYVQQTMQGLAGFSPKDGSKLWYFSNPAYKVAVIPTPIVHDGMVYGVAGYGAGASLLRVSGADGTLDVEQLYKPEARALMDNKHGGVVAVGDDVFGWSDAKGGKWVCQDFKSGKEVWSSKALGRGSLTCADGNLYCYAEKDGTCVLVPATAAGWKEQGRFKIPKQTARREFHNNIWTHPVVANGKLYLRDQELLFCYDVKEGSR
jgi:outer membrane protein assembly factor BamB